MCTITPFTLYLSTNIHTVNQAIGVSLKIHTPNQETINHTQTAGTTNVSMNEKQGDSGANLSYIELDKKAYMRERNRDWVVL